MSLVVLFPFLNSVCRLSLQKSMMFFFTTFTLLSFIHSSLTSDEVHLNFMLGSEGVLSCSSSFAPPWSKTSSADGKYNIIGVNGKRHPNWNEPRHLFTVKDDAYSLKINDFHLSDAGIYVCASDSPKTFLVSVLR